MSGGRHESASPSSTYVGRSGEIWGRCGGGHESAKPEQHRGEASLRARREAAAVRARVEAAMVLLLREIWGYMGRSGEIWGDLGVLLGGGQLSPDQLPREPRPARRLAKHRLRLPRVGAHHPRPDAELLVLRRPEQPAPAQPVCDRLQRQVGDAERGGREQQQRRDQQDVVLAVGDRALLPRVLDGGGASLGGDPPGVCGLLIECAC